MRSMCNLSCQLTLSFKAIIIVAFSSVFFAVCEVHASSSKSTKVLVLGDSLSAAYNMAPELGWVALLQDKANETDELTIEVVNASVSGATTAAGLQMLPIALERHQPHIVILGLAANDGLQGKPLNYIRQNLDRLIQLCKNSGAEVLLLGQRIPPNYGEAYAGPFYEQFSSLAQLHQVAYVPFLLEGVAGHPELMMSDRLHPTSQAQAKVLANVWPEFVSVLNSLD